MSVLKDINFSQGIRSDNIDYNFTALNGEIKRERLRTSGWGLVEGFILAVVPRMQVTISDGIIINTYGDEKTIAATTMTLDEPDVIEATELCLVDNDGKITLKEKAYSAKKHGWLEDDYYQANYPMAELVITDATNSATIIKAVHVNEDVVYLDAIRWAGRTVNVSYNYALERVDSIFLSTEGTYHIEKSVMSDSPSHVDLDEYNWFCICMATVHIGSTNSVTVNMGKREYRRVYVDKSNKLYLNGELYEHMQVIHFVQPDPAYDKALWYDAITNMLYIWIQVEGKYQWLPVNKPILTLSRDVKLWEPEDCPSDLQTFTFNGTETNLQFVPGGNQLDIIIDNAPLMKDQFSEITKTTVGGELIGVGFKLVEPLDAVTHVECHVLHNTQEAPLRTVFQRFANFASSNYVVVDSNIVASPVITVGNYKIGSDALEIFLDGKRLLKNIDYKELIEEGDYCRDTEITDRGINSTLIQLICSMVVGQTLSWKIINNVASYADIDDYIEKVQNVLQGQIDTAKSQIIDLQQESTQMVDNTVPEIKTSINSLNTAIDTKLSTNATLGWNNMPVDFKKQLYKKRIDLTMTAIAVNTLSGIGADRYLQVYLFDTATTNRILINGIDYQISEGADPTIALRSELVSGAKTLYVTGFELGLA